MRADHWLLGYEDLQIRAQHAACFMNLCRSAGYAYLPLRRASGEGLVVRCRSALAARLRRDCAARGIDARVLRRGGLPLACYRYRARLGLLIGALLGVLLLIGSGSVLWDIRIDGECAVSEQYVREQLEAAGLYVGCSLRRTDTREVENRVLRGAEQIAWISVNLKGSVAYVQIRELQRPESARNEEAANLISGYDAVIESVKPISGAVVVEVGQTVRQGALLISGVRDSATQGYRVTGAQGEVIGRTQESLAIQIPYASEEKVYTGREFCEKTLIFFGKSIKLSKNTGIIGGSCDTIYIMENWTLPGGIVLPVGVRTMRVREYEIRTVEHTKEQAYEQAQLALDAALQQQAQDVLLLSKTVRLSYSPTHCTLLCEYSCLRDIAVSQPFYVAGRTAGE